MQASPDLAAVQTSAKHSANPGFGGAGGPGVQGASMGGQGRWEGKKHQNTRKSQHKGLGVFRGFRGVWGGPGGSRGGPKGVQRFWASILCRRFQ